MIFRLVLADDLDIAPDGKIYFSEATLRYTAHTWATDALEGRGNGRIIVFDPSTGKTRTSSSATRFSRTVSAWRTTGYRSYSH